MWQKLLFLKYTKGTYSRSKEILCTRDWELKNRKKWFRESVSEMLRTSSRCENYLHDVDDGANTTCNQSSTNRILLKIRAKWESTNGKLKNKKEKLVRHMEEPQTRRILGK